MFKVCRGPARNTHLCFIVQTWRPETKCVMGETSPTLSLCMTLLKNNVNTASKYGTITSIHSGQLQMNPKLDPTAMPPLLHFLYTFNREGGGVLL